MPSNPEGTLRVWLRRLRERTYIDIGAPDATIFVAGMGRSGTTWIGSIINHDFSHRVLFEPFRPHEVPDAAAFGPLAYVRPTNRESGKHDAAERILSGRTPRGTIDRYHRGLVFKRRIVKEIRCNLMLGWLKTLRPTMPLVLPIRHPFAVSASWLRLGWGHIAGGKKLELDVILEQHELLEDFPLINTLARTIERRDPFERHLFEWCILHLVPLQQLAPTSAHVMFYEDIVQDPMGAVQRLGTYLGSTISGPSLDRALRANRADFLRRGSDADRVKLLSEWQTVLTTEQIARGHEILSAFGLDGLYDEDGLPSSTARSGILRTLGATA